MANPRRDSDGPNPSEKAWAAVRIVLGLAQIMGAVVSFYLLVQNGMNALTFGAVTITCLFTTISVLLFGRRKD